LTPSLFCLSAASLDRWPQSVLLFHLDPKPSEPPPGRLLRVLGSPSARSSKNQELLKGDSMEGHMKALMTRKFFFLHVGGSSAGAALELPHCHLAPGAATKSEVEAIPKLSFCLGIAETLLTFKCQVQAVHLPTLKSCRPSAVKLIHATVGHRSELITSTLTYPKLMEEPTKNL